MYGKLFVSIYDGTLAEDWRALVTFQQMIILCDQDGVLDMTPLAIQKRTGIPIEHIKAGIEILESEDPYSRTPKEHGKRIIRLSDERPWGWLIVNHKHYRDLRTAEERREYMREYMREKRAKDKLTETNESLQKLHVSKLANTDTDTDTNTKIKTRGFRPPSLKEVQDYCKERDNKVDPQSFVDHYETNGWMRGKTKIKSWQACVRTWEKNSTHKDCKTPAQVDVKVLAAKHNLTARPGESWEQFEQRVRNTR